MILQFGTSRFLQAHVDLFAWEAAQTGQDVPDIAIVQVSDDVGRAGRLKAFDDPGGFPVLIRGLEAGALVERQVQVRSVKRGLSARKDWAELCTLFVSQATHIVSNRGDSGYALAASDQTLSHDGPPQSFCAILLKLLHLRWEAGRPGLTMLPCELVAGNGARLRQIVQELSVLMKLEGEFIAWLADECLWVNTLVDRIVSAPLDPAGAVAEPYALWAIEHQPKLQMPYAHLSVRIVDDLEPYEKLKVHILNLGHSWLAEEWLQAGSQADASVKSMLNERRFADRLEQVYAREVIPGFAVMGWGAQAQDYVGKTLDRFANPYLEHRLSDIHTHHPAKVNKRVGAFVDWVDAPGRSIAMRELRALAARYRDHA
jgi:tagaturonate reductase